MTIGLRHFVRPFRKAFRAPPDDLRFYHQVRRGRIGNRIRVTCRGRADGGGAQVHGVIAALAFCAETGLGYVHTDFAAIEHGAGASDWVRRWEEFFSLGAGEARLDPARDRLVTLDRFLAHPELWNADNIVVQCLHFMNFFNRVPRSFDRIDASLRRKYALSDKSSLPRHDLAHGITIAVHVRRGDANKAAHPKYFTDDDLICRTIGDAMAACASLGLRCRVNLYSEGRPEDFARFVDMGCNLHLDESVFTTLDNMIRADIFVMAKSSFSYVPALLSGGIKLYERFSHPARAGWIVRDREGGVDRKRLVDALRAQAANRLRQAAPVPPLAGLLREP